MELVEAIKTRRSVRQYKNARIPEPTIRELLEMATWAPSGMNGQPWAFVVVEDREYLKSFSDRSKALLLERMKEAPALEVYREKLAAPDFDIFYGAPALVLVFGNPASYTYKNDCSMAALNLMLAARERGIGSCWIGFACFTGNSPEVKKELNVPLEYELVAPVILGYPEAWPGEVPRKEPHLINWIGAGS